MLDIFVQKLNLPAWQILVKIPNPNVTEIRQVSDMKLKEGQACYPQYSLILFNVFQEFTLRKDNVTCYTHTNLKTQTKFCSE
jgi:hypothetical protein